MRRHSAAQAVLVACCVLLPAPPASADPPRSIVVRWTGPAPCPTEASFVGNTLGHIGGRRTRPDVRARVDAWPSEAGGWKADIEVSAEGETTQRQVHGETCDAVARAASIVVSVAAIVDATASPAPAAPAAPIPAPPPPVPEPVPLPPKVILPPRPEPPPPKQPAPSRASSAVVPARWRTLTLAGGALLDVGSLPTVSPGGEIDVRWAPSWWSVEASSSVLAPEQGSLPSLPTQGASIWFLQVGGRACAALGVARFQVGPCAGLHAGWLFAQGVGGAPTKYAGTAEVAISSWGARGSVRVSRLVRAYVGAEAAVPFERPVFVIENAPGTVFRPSAGAFRGTLGIDVTL